MYGEQSLAVALGSAGDAAHLGGRGQTDGLQDERKGIQAFRSPSTSRVYCAV